MRWLESSLYKHITYHDWTDYRELVIQKTRLLNVASLEGDLQTGAAHPKPHAVHVDVVGSGVALGTSVAERELFHKGGGCVGVFEYCKREEWAGQNR